MSVPIVLGSSSQSRQKVLKDAGYEFTTASPDIDEKAVGSENRLSGDAHSLVLAIARAKAQALSHIKGAILITCDQVVVYNGEIREKPVGRAQAREYLISYEHAPAETVSGIHVLNTLNGKSAEGVDVCKQHFKHIPDTVVEQVLDKGMVFHCCGGFMIDEPLLHPYLGDRIGTEDSILGLDMAMVKQLMSQVE